MNRFFPEGSLLGTPENKAAVSSISALREAMEKGTVLEGRAGVCDSGHNLIVDLPCGKGIIPRTEGAVGIEDGSTRDIALITKVNRPVCFKVTDISEENGKAGITLSRRAVQQECIEKYISELRPGDIIPARVTHLEQFGAFVDIGCGLPSLIPIDAVSVSRISHPGDRFVPGQLIKAVVKDVCGSRVWLSHKELLGTWEENAAAFSCGETVSGIVRSVEDYGIFVELAPNLAGLAEPRAGVKAGQRTGVYIKALIPEKMKVKLIIVDVFDEELPPDPINYFIPEDVGHIDRWRYSAENSEKVIETIFE
ncbi:MAG: S1 RNA-binding domain-containing protein [Oscillospiraceae bacterium]|nr:S1 RNA-binding domain-containing protein [Oscillospiraceae bacterium]